MNASPKAAAFDVHEARGDFPILAQEMRGKPLVFLDSASSAQKPRQVIGAMADFYAREYANIHRGVYWLSERATARYEEAREATARFLKAEAREIVFVRGTTEAINLVAQSFVKPRLEPGDEIVLTEMEHHANIVPWQMVAKEKGAKIVPVPVNDDGVLELDAWEKAFSPKTRFASVTHVSNALGTVNPVHKLCSVAHAHGVPILVDGAQAAPHFPLDVRDIGCDFYAFSGHKVFGPTGIGALFGKYPYLAKMPPYQGGGDMILSVSFEETQYAPAPAKFEAGTPHIAGAVGLAAAIGYLSALDRQGAMAHEDALLRAAEAGLARLPGVRVVGRSPQKAGAVSFVIEGIHPHDIGTVLDREGVAIRAGHHCAQPLMTRLGLAATARASFAFYNTMEEVGVFLQAVEKTIALLK